MPSLKQGPHIQSDHAASLLYFTNVRILDIHPGTKCSSPSVSSLLWQHSGSCLCFFKDLFLCFWVFLPVCMHTTWVPAALGGQRGCQVVSCSVGVGNGTWVFCKGSQCSELSCLQPHPCISVLLVAHQLVLISQALSCLLQDLSFPPPVPDTATVAALHNTVGSHDGGCPAHEREVVPAGTLQGHQWGREDQSKPTFPSPCHLTG